MAFDLIFYPVVAKEGAEDPQIPYWQPWAWQHFLWVLDDSKIWMYIQGLRALGSLNNQLC